MKILVTSDIHGNRQMMDKLKTLAKSVDLVLVCGDIGGKYFGVTKGEFLRRQAEDATVLCSKLSETNTPFRFILGNDDWIESDDEHHLTKPEVFGDTTIVPFEWVRETPFHTNRELTERQLARALAGVNADRNTIVVAHTPPYGAGDVLWTGEHCGSAAVAEWIRVTQPKIWLCGHIHEDNCAKMLGNTLVCNCACYDDVQKAWIVDSNTMEYHSVVF